MNKVFLAITAYLIPDMDGKIIYKSVIAMMQSCSLICKTNYNGYPEILKR